MTLKRALLLTSAAGVLVSSFAGYAAAQAIEEIIVTSRKRAENLQEIPLSVTAFTAEAIKDKDIRGVYELQNMTANFAFDKNFGRRFDRPVIRGQSNIQGDANASFFIDGVFVSGSITGISTDALDRIEVLRGPQAALYGRATFAGAINYITKQPQDEFEGQVNARAGSHDDYKGALWMRGPIIEGKLQYFLSGNWEYYGSQYRNNNPGVPTVAPFTVAPTRADNSKVGNEETKDATIKLRAIASENLEFSARVSHADTEDGHYATVWYSAADLNCFRPGIDPGTFARARGYYCGKIEQAGKTPMFNIPDIAEGVTTVQTIGGVATTLTAPGTHVGNTRSTWRWVGDATLTVEDWEIVAQATYNTDLANFATDNDRSIIRAGLSGAVLPNGQPVLPRNGSFAGHTVEAYRDRSGELRITSPESNRVRGILGGYYYYNQLKSKSRQFTGTKPTFDGAGLDYTASRTRNLAAFAQVAGDITDQLTMSVEGRYAEEKKVTFATGFGARRGEDSFNAFTPRVTLDYKLNDDVLLYALVAKGNKPGGFNAGLFSTTAVSTASFNAAAANGTLSVKEEKQWTYEAGAKTTLLDGRATLNAGGFYIDWTDQQLTRIIDITNPAGAPSTAAILVNVGKTKVVGTEIEASLQATDMLSLTANYGLADSTIKKYNDDEITITTGRDDPLLTNGGNAKGKTLPLAPKHTFNASATLRDALTADAEWFASTNLRYETKKWTEVANYQYTGDFYIWNARLGVSTDVWEVALYGNNLLDDRTPTGSLRFVDVTVPPFAGGSRRGFDVGLRRGREFGLTGQYNF